MKIKVIAIGNRLPSWINDGVDEYAKRISGNTEFHLIELNAARRSKNGVIEKYRQTEAELIRNKLGDQDYCIAMDEKGKRFSTETLANKLQTWIDDNQQISFIIGGADGLDPQLQKQAAEKWSLSDLTMAHGLARIVLVEQLYRANSILQGHPYHRI